MERERWMLEITRCTKVGRLGDTYATGWACAESVFEGGVAGDGKSAWYACVDVLGKEK